MQTNRGFSLAEVLVSMFLVTTGLLAMGHTMGKAIEANYRTSQEGDAIGFALQKIEVLKTVPFTHADLSAGAHSDTPAAGFARGWSVTTTGNAKSITLTVTRPIPNQTKPVMVVLGIERVQ